MAKRKRLMPARLDGLHDPDTLPAGLETKSIFPRFAEASPRRAPIADVASDAATAAAFEEVAQNFADARAEGRLIQRLPLEAVEEDYLVRDRMEVGEEEMQVLCDSLRARGQQTAIEVTDLGNGRWGLISGWRRLSALKRLRAEGAGPGTVLAIARQPTEAGDAYLAMVEENEIRVGLSFYERARIVVRAVEKGVYRNDRLALSALFAAAPRAKRSKIGSFLRIVRALDAVLRFPASLSEKAGLALAAGLERDEGLETRLVEALRAADVQSAEEEARVIARAMIAPAEAAPEAAPESRTEGAPRLEPEELREGLVLTELADGGLKLQGPALADPAFRARLLALLREAR